jgi:hypothetical protein
MTKIRCISVLYHALRQKSHSQEGLEIKNKPTVRLLKVYIPDPTPAGLSWMLPGAPINYDQQLLLGTPENRLRESGNKPLPERFQLPCFKVLKP